MTEKENYDERIDVIGYIKVILKYWIMIVIIVIASTILAGIVNLKKPAVYVASATFFPVNIGGPQGSQYESVANIQPYIISILESRSMADKIIEELDLKKAWGTTSMDKARRTLKAITSLSVRKEGMIELFVRTALPQFSADIANAYVNNLDYFNTQFSLGALKQTVQVIDRAIAPEEREPRNTKKILGITLFLSLAASIFLAFLIEFIRGAEKPRA